MCERVIEEQEVTLESVLMIQKDFMVEYKPENEVALVFPQLDPSIIIREPDSDSEAIGTEDIKKFEPTMRTVFGNDRRVKVKNPDKIKGYMWIGRIKSEFWADGQKLETRYGSGWKFGENLVMTAANLIFDLARRKFADTIVFEPALNGKTENQVYEPITIGSAMIHRDYKYNVNAEGGIDSLNPWDYAFLSLNPDSDKPKGYFGMYYQFSAYEAGEGFMLAGYAGDLPTNAPEDEKGSYMYRQMGKIVGRGSVPAWYMYHDGDTSKEEAGAPMYTMLETGYGFTSMGMNAFEGSKCNYGLKITTSILGAMKYLKKNEIKEIIEYKQPEKPQEVGLNTIQSIIPILKDIEKTYYEYYNLMLKVLPEIGPLTKAKMCIGITNFLRHEKYSSLQWVITLLNPINQGFVNYMKDTNCDLFNRIYKYIRKKPESINLEDGSGGVLDLAHMAATMEGYFSNTTIVPSFWVGWGGDLATGMKDTTQLLPEGAKYQDIFRVAYNTIGGNSSCNFNDFCCDMDAIKLVDLFNNYEIENGSILECFSNCLTNYYTSHVSNRFTYIYADIGEGSSLSSLYMNIYHRMTGTLERAPEIEVRETKVGGLLTAKGGNPKEDVIVACCNALAHYFSEEINRLK